ncbi:MAG: chaperone modulator CbpM [Burkholderiales bacterium]|jgi:chaperone modulatory protein CbpM
MKIEITEAQWLHDRGEVSLEELVELSGLPEQLLIELVEHGALEPVESAASGAGRATRWHFSAECVVAVRTASRLREDFELDANAMSVALMLVERIHELEAQLQELQCQFPQPKVRLRG